MITLLKIGYAGDGVFHLDEENRKIQKVEVLNADSLQINFPGSTNENFNYLKLEAIMKFYMNLKDHQTMTDAINQIIDKGFFYPLRPSLHIEAERI